MFDFLERGMDLYNSQIENVSQQDGYIHYVINGIIEYIPFWKKQIMEIKNEMV
jgi:hypothetical protein